MPRLIENSRAKERGGLTIMPHYQSDTQAGLTFIPFLFNPHEFEEDDTQNWSKKVIPQQEDPSYIYVGGEGATFKFDIAMEAERLQEFSESGIPNIPGNLEQYQASIEVLKFPNQVRAGLIFEASPKRVMVVFGKFYRIGYIYKTPTKYTDFFTDGTMRTLTMSVTMHLAYGRGRQYRKQATTRFVRDINGNLSSQFNG